MLLTRSNKVTGIASVSKGGISVTVTGVRIILQYAIKANASVIIICHYHPSGNIQPGESEMKITRKIKDSGNLMDVQLLDHLIIIPEVTVVWPMKELFKINKTNIDVLIPKSPELCKFKLIGEKSSIVLIS